MAKFAANKVIDDYLPSFLDIEEYPEENSKLRPEWDDFIFNTKPQSDLHDVRTFLKECKRICEEGVERNASSRGGAKISQQTLASSVTKLRLLLTLTGNILKDESLETSDVTELKKVQEDVDTLLKIAKLPTEQAMDILLPLMNKRLTPGEVLSLRNSPNARAELSGKVLDEAMTVVAVIHGKYESGTFQHEYPNPLDIVALKSPEDKDYKGEHYYPWTKSQDDWAKEVAKLEAGVLKYHNGIARFQGLLEVGRPRREYTFGLPENTTTTEVAFNKWSSFMRASSNSSS